MFDTEEGGAVVQDLVRDIEPGVLVKIVTFWRFSKNEPDLEKSKLPGREHGEGRGVCHKTGVFLEFK